MRPLEDRDNQWAEYHRLSKAQALADHIKSEVKITQRVLEQLPTQSYAWWGATAKDAGVEAPSPSTVEAVVGLLAPEVSFGYDHPKNVLEGLPTP